MYSIKKFSGLVIICFVFLSAQLFSQQPIGKTRNATVENNVWRISSLNGKDGSTGGDLFIENYPYVNLSKNQSYWVGGYIKMEKSGNYQEDNEYFSSQVCNGLYSYIHNGDTMLNKMSQASMFFQIFHGDLAGYQRLGNESERYRIFFNTYGKGGVWHKTFSESLKDSIDKGDYIKFIMAFVHHDDSLIDPDIPPQYKSGSFIYYQILDSLGNLKKSGRPVPPALCYNPYDSIKGDGTYRIYMGSDSHGNIEDQEPSIKDWMNGLLTGDTNCEYKPSEMNPLLGSIYRMIFVQQVLTISDVNSFFNDPLNYQPQSNVKLDFPKLIEEMNGYNVYIPNSHWEDYQEMPGQNGDITSRLFYHVPNTGGPRNGIRTTYTDNNNPSDYEISYDLKDRFEKVDRKFRSVTFYLGNDQIKYQQPDFNVILILNTTNPANNAVTRSISLKCSPLIQNIKWEQPYLQVPLSPVQGGNDYFQKYVINMENLLTEYPSLTGYQDFVSIDRIIFCGVFDLAGLTLYNHIPQIVETDSTRIRSYSFKLENNYPNPFNPVTTINYSIPVQSAVKLEVYNILGQKIATLVNEVKLPGSYSEEFKAGSLPSGIYFYRLTSENFSLTKKMLLLK